MELTRWTPDGTAVVVRDGRGDDGGSYLRVPLDGRAPETLLQLTPRDDRRADLSPDGRTMVVARESEPGHRDLVGIDVATGEERWRRKGTTDDAEPRWTPDGSSIVFVTNMTGCHSLGQVRMEGGRPTASATVLSEMGPTTQLLGFGPDGVLLIRQRLYSYQTITSSIDLEARSFSEARLLRTSQCDMLVGADWNRDGSRIAHVAGRPAAGVRSQLVIERPEGQDRSEIDLAYDFVEFAQTRWAPDSGRVAVLYRTGLPLGSKAFDVLEIADVRRDSLARTTIERWPVEGQAKSVAWDPRGDALYFRQGSEIVRASLQSNTPTFTPVYHAPSEVGLTRGLDVSREGVLAIGHSRDVDTRECIVRVVRPGSPPHYQRTLEGWCQSLTWTRDGRRILVGTAPDVGVSSLFLIEPATGSVDRIEGTAPEPNFWHLSLGPDDRQVLFTAGRTTQPWKMIQIRGIR
jgi:Tol biopolymer transport system component